MNQTIIIIDDDVEQIELLKLSIKQHDPKINCISFIYADDALKSLANYSILPDYIFIDFNLPRKEGIECLYELRKNSKYDKIKIIVYAKTVPDVIHEALLEAGADLIIEKPIKLSSYKTLISHIFNNFSSLRKVI